MTSELVKFILKNATKFEWSLQGFGMLRLYINKNLRLHVWSRKHVVPKVSDIHTHPWDFTSRVISGSIANYVYHREEGLKGSEYNYQTIQCGPGGGLVGELRQIKLACYLPKLYGPDSSFSRCEYTQYAEEIHRSQSSDGAVTLVQRRFYPNTEHALVFWPVGEQWVSAEPRFATQQEVEEITQNALEKWNGV